MEYKDYYQIMGVSRDATADEIKRAYRKLARKFHPDVSKEADAEARFKEVGEAYEVLKDPEKRAAYDQLGARWQAGEDFRPPPGWQPAGSGAEFHGADADFSEFFESIFGARPGGAGRGGGFREGPRRHGFAGEDVHSRVVIPIDDAFKGATRSITLRYREPDERGRVTDREKTLSVSIPKGVRQGQHIRLSGQGQAGIGGGKAGDLYLEVEFAPHPYFHVEGKDVFLDLPVAPWEAALGARIKAPTPTGTVELTIPPGTNNGRKLRLKGRGIPGKTPGDLYAVIRVTLPPAESDEARQAYRELEEKLRFNPRKELGVEA